MSTRKIIDVIAGQPARDGAGVELVRMIGQPRLMDLDPFLLLDAFRSDDPNDYIAGFPAHPHRGFETVTYLLDGRMRHRDNAGNEGVIEPGGVQWMTAGRGIVHSEMPEQENGLLSGFQLWINLPASHKMTAPGYQEFDSSQIPVETRAGAQVRVIAGTTGNGTRGPVSQPLTEPLYLDATVEPGQAFSEQVSEGHTVFVQMIEGSMTLSGTANTDQEILRDQLAILGDGDEIHLEAGPHGARFLLIAGKPLDESIARAGPFVMNTEAELQQAFRDYQSGRL